MLTLAVLACLVASEAGGVPEAARSDDMVPWDACEGVRVFSGIPALVKDHGVVLGRGLPLSAVTSRPCLGLMQLI